MKDNPWQTVWAPNLNFPWSGSVAQKIEPSTSWFFGAIDPDAGDARMEKKAFEKASYGRQLGLITEILLALAKESTKIDRSKESPLSRLTEIKDAIEEIKKKEASSTADNIEERLKWLKKTNKLEFELLAGRIKSILGDTAGL
ncbi:MAG: hypothetical protein WA049_14575 [Ferribacterium limneticum]